MSAAVFFIDLRGSKGERDDGGLIGVCPTLMVQVNTPDEDGQKRHEDRHPDECRDATRHVRGSSNRCACRIAGHEGDPNS
jgi:hypothetical protein